MSNACVDYETTMRVPNTDCDRAVGGRGKREKREGGRGRERKQETYHLTELDGRLAYLIPNPNRDLKDGEKERGKKKSVVNSSNYTLSRPSWNQRGWEWGSNNELLRWGGGR
jgi:hypothetical protein